MSHVCRRKQPCWLNKVFILYICVSIGGCATPALYKDAKRLSQRQSKFWTIEDVTFAASRQQRYIRLCVDLQRFSEKISTEVTIDLKEVNSQLAEQTGFVARLSNQDRLSTVNAERPQSLEYYSSEPAGIGDRSVEYMHCDDGVEEGETELDIVETSVGDKEFPALMDEIGPHAKGGITIYIIERKGKKHLAIGAPESEYPQLGRHAIRCYGEDQRQYGAYLLMPVAIWIDFGIIVVGVFRAILCIIIFPCIIHEMAKSQEPSRNSRHNTIFSPEPMIQPNCK